MKKITTIPYEFPVSSDGKYILMQSDNQVLLSRREQLGLTQQQVADIAGIQLRQYQRIESGEREIENCSMHVGLSVCAALLLDPYGFISFNSEDQPDPATLRPQPVFDSGIPEDLTKTPKRPGRKPIKRNAMKVYLNHERYTAIIPTDVLEAMGCPEYFQFLYNKDNNKIVLCPAEENDPEVMDIPDLAYGGECIFAIPDSPYSELLRKEYKWGSDIYEASAVVVRDKKGKLGILIDPSTAQKTDTITGSFTIPECTDDEGIEDDSL